MMNDTPDEMAETISSMRNVITQGTVSLQALQHTLKQTDEEEKVAAWTRQIESLSEKAAQTKVIIGVVGATSSGKSSLLNALLGEKQLIPTNCMRACTAVVTEIAWNGGAGPHWSATIEFTSDAEWRKEIQLLLEDATEDVKHIYDSERPAGIAFSKITAVYPEINSKNIAKCDVDTLMRAPEVVRCLGLIEEVEARTSEELHDKLKKYIDSKDKLFGIRTTEMEYWPLITRIRITGDAHVLRSGCVLVDLPGVADINAARAAVARNYLKKCAALWVVAPIMRAVDDKVARHMLGESFQSQLHRDGTLDRVTFICTKTDEMIMHEARATLNRDLEFLRSMQAHDQEKAQVSTQLKQAEEALERARQEHKLASNEHKIVFKGEATWRRLKSWAARGVKVHPPLPDAEVNRKRPISGETSNVTGTRKSARLQGYASAAQDRSNESTSSSEEDEDAVSNAIPGTDALAQDKTLSPLTLSQIDVQLKDLISRRSTLKKQKEDAEKQKQKLGKSLAELQRKEEKIVAREWVACVHGRNQYATSNIQEDFRRGMAELVTFDIDDEDYDPSADALAEDDVKTLPVFCVSSQGYQKLKGHLEDEAIASCFQIGEDTGIPALQEHAFTLGRSQLLADKENFVIGARRLLTSLRLWSWGAEGKEDADVEVHYTEIVHRAIDEFLEVFKRIVVATCDLIESNVNTRLFASLPKATATGRQKAMEAVERWNASPKDVEPGLYYMTFKAVARREGTYTNPKRSINFSEDLLEDFMHKIDKHWGPCFGNNLKQNFKKGVYDLTQALGHFSEQFNKLLDGRGTSDNTKVMFSEQVQRFAHGLSQMFLSGRYDVQSRAKEINRMFLSSVDESMAPVYPKILNEGGKGSLARMKRIIKGHVEENLDNMFVKATDTVRSEIEDALSEMQAGFNSEVENLCNTFRQDCLFIASVKARDFNGLNEKHQQAIVAALGKADIDFEALSGAASDHPMPAVALFQDQDWKPL